MASGEQGVAGVRRGNPARAAAITLATALAVITGGLGYVDGTGLFAPENWLDAGAIPTFATSPAWATVVYLPLLIIGSGLVAHRILRVLAPGTPSRWAFWASWSGVVLAAFLAKFLYSLLLLAVAGPHALHALPSIGAVLAECGLSAAKCALLGLLAAVPAAAAYRISIRRHRSTGGDGAQTASTTKAGTAASKGTARRMWSPVAFLVGAVVAAKATDSTSAWTEGSGHRLLLPLAGLAGAYVAARLLWAGFGKRLAPGGRTLWALCATTTAAAALGFLLPWLIDAVVNGFGGGLYPIIGALTHLGAGALAGVVTSTAGQCWAMLGSVVRLSRPIPAMGRYAFGGIALVGALCLELLPLSTVADPYAVPGQASADGASLLALTVRHGAEPMITDSAGRQVLLRGVNVNQLVDYGQPDPAKATVRPLTDNDYAQMASVYGFDVQRLNLSWSALEPTRGTFDQAYVARVRTAVDQAARHGIYTVLDMHQDTYSKYVTATAGTQCRMGADLEFGNDGAPDWATLTGGAKGCGFMGRDLSPNVEQAFTNLYSDTDGIGAEFARAWGVLAQEFAADTAVAGYDLLNEPGPGNAPGVTSSLLLGRLYQQVITSIRAAESQAAQGFHHLVVFEPSILWSGLGFDASPPVGFSDDPALVFSPHLYSQSITMDQGLGVTLTTIEHGYDLARRAADAYGVPLWSGEWGWFGDVAAVGDRFNRFLDLQNANRLGSAIWVWKKACGDPQTGANDAVAGGLNLLSCTTGADVPSPAFQTTALSQAYPRSAPGTLTSLSSSPTTMDMKLAGTGTGMLDVWAPGPAAPAVSSTGLTQLAVTAQPGGGWRLTAYASGAYRLTLS
jgi:hypothetical protein